MALQIPLKKIVFDKYYLKYLHWKETGVQIIITFSKISTETT